MSKLEFYKIVVENSNFLDGFKYPAQIDLLYRFIKEEKSVSILPMEEGRFYVSSKKSIKSRIVENKGFIGTLSFEKREKSIFEVLFEITRKEN